MYRANGTFSVGTGLHYRRGKTYDSIPEGFEGHFTKIEKEEKKVKGKKVETSAKKTKKETR